MKLVLSIDVEEEGLFSGRYPRRATGVSNVAELRRLDSLVDEFRLAPTLLVTHAVACDEGCRRLLAGWRERHGAELGAHLHPWNTPPFADECEAEPTVPDRLPEALLEAKLLPLIDAVGAAGGRRPTAFRMGRYHLTGPVARRLAAAGIRVDGSAVPLRTEVGGPDWFLSPADPHWMDTGAGPLLEAPLTVVPLWTPMAHAWHRLMDGLPRGVRQRGLSAYRRVGAAGVQPAWFSLPVMKLAARLHRRRGGRVLHMHLHSSELLPGATPAFRTEEDVGRLVGRIRSFLAWLRREMPVEFTTMSALAGGPGEDAGPGGVSLVSLASTDHTSSTVHHMRQANKARGATP